MAIVSSDMLRLKIDGKEISHEISCGIVDNRAWIKFFNTDKNQLDEWNKKLGLVFNVRIENNEKEIYYNERVRLEHVYFFSKLNSVVYMKLVFIK